MKITHAVEIAAPPSLVWTYLEDTEKTKLWMKGLIEDTPTSEGPTRVGSTFRMKIKEGRKIAEYDGEILAHDPERHMRVRITGGCLGADSSMTADYVLTEFAPDRTRLDYVCTGDLAGIYRVLAPIMRLFAGMQIRSFFKTLRDLCESAGTASALTV